MRASTSPEVPGGHIALPPEQEVLPAAESVPPRHGAQAVRPPGAAAYVMAGHRPQLRQRHCPSLPFAPPPQRPEEAIVLKWRAPLKMKQPGGHPPRPGIRATLLAVHAFHPPVGAVSRAVSAYPSALAAAVHSSADVICATQVPEYFGPRPVLTASHDSSNGQVLSDELPSQVSYMPAGQEAHPFCGQLGAPASEPASASVRRRLVREPDMDHTAGGAPML